MFRIDTVEVSAVPDSGENWLVFIDWKREGFGVELSLPRKALGIPVFDDKGLAHLTIGTTDARLGLVCLDAPNMPATITNSFVLFHRISVSALY